MSNLRKLPLTLAILMGLSLILTSVVASQLMISQSISSSGWIQQFSLADGYESEIRAVFIHAFSDNGIDAETVVATLAEYNVNTIVIEALGINYARYPSDVLSNWADFGLLPEFVDAAHSRGIKLYVGMNVLADGVPTPKETYATVKADGSYGYGTCPTKQATRDLIKAEVEELVTKYDIDGFLFDYIRYKDSDECYCSECEAKFIADTGLTDVNWPADVVSGGKYYNDFLEWRSTPINELVRDMRNWMLAQKSDLKFAAAVWNFGFNPVYWRQWIGQDATYWVDQGWLDWVAPMMYTDNLETLESDILALQDLLVGSQYGKIPLVPFIDTCVDSVSSPSNFAERVNKIRELGAGGWIVWRYGGPGDGSGSGSPDITAYFDLIQTPLTFTLGSISYSVEQTTATITWLTDLPANSKVEYSTSPLFTATYKYHEASNFHYWDMAYNAGSIQMDYAEVVDHEITLTGLLPQTKYYFRVQSEDSSGVATSHVLTFTTQ